MASASFIDRFVRHVGRKVQFDLTVSNRIVSNPDRTASPEFDAQE
jgi:hypothetical protein